MKKEEEKEGFVEVEVGEDQELMAAYHKKIGKEDLM